MPERMADAARAIIEARSEPATPRDAATVMLLRPAASLGASPGGSPGAAAGASPRGEFEVYMLRRKPTMAFAPGAYVFPGGSVDPRDADDEVAWAGPPAEKWGRVFDAEPDLARALVCAAVRETFEESGVLLAGPTASALVADTTADDWEADRQALLARTMSLADLLGRRNLVLRADLLRPWARWITPAVEPRRFDTRFFAAELPPGQRTRDVGGEAAAVRWIAPAAALREAGAGDIELWFPTSTTLAELAGYPDVPSALASERDMTPRLPEVIADDDGVWLTL